MTDASRDERTMVIELVDAAITDLAVFRARRTVDIASITVPPTFSQGISFIDRRPG